MTSIRLACTSMSSFCKAGRSCDNALQSVRHVHVWLREEGIALPTARHCTAEGRSVVWRLPLYNTVHNILTNPVYAGAYSFGRTMSKVSVEEGRKRVKRGVRRPLTEWDVLLKDQDEGYISWAEFERNQRVIANNATGKGMFGLAKTCKKLKIPFFDDLGARLGIPGPAIPQLATLVSPAPS